MIELLFSSPYYALVPDNLFNMARLNVIDTASYMSSDTIKKTYVFSNKFTVASVKHSSYQFGIRYSINNVDNIFSFFIPYIYNRAERLRVFQFTAKNSIVTVSNNTKTFTLKNKIQIATNYKQFDFSVKFQNTSAELKSFNFKLRNRLEKNTILHKDFMLPYTLSTGGDQNSSITINSTVGGVSSVSYSIDGISANIGSVAEMLASEILTPKVVYIVINNGSYSLLRIARFEIRESTKLLTLEDNGVSLLLDVDKVKLTFTADISTPISVKIYRGVP
jgi:hypothetical protein